MANAPSAAATAVSSSLAGPSANVVGPPAASMVLASLGQAAFVWDLVSDTIIWSDHVHSVFRDIPFEALVSGAEFSKLIEPARSIRSDALSNSSPADGSGGESYRIEYGVRSS